MINFIFYWTAKIIEVATYIVAGLLILRVIVNWIISNPFNRLSYTLTRITEPLVRPLRSQFRGRGLRYDLLPLVTAVLILAGGLSVAWLIAGLGSVLSSVARSITTGEVATGKLIGDVIILLSLFYIAAIILRWILPMVGVRYHNKFYLFIFTVTEPLLKPLRRYFVINMFDLSPMIAIILVQLLAQLLASAVSG